MRDFARRRDSRFSLRARDFNFFTCGTETSKCLKCELEPFRGYSGSYIRYKQIGTSRLSYP